MSEVDLRKLLFCAAATIALGCGAPYDQQLLDPRDAAAADSLLDLEAPCTLQFLDSYLDRGTQAWILIDARGDTLRFLWDRHMHGPRGDPSNRLVIGRGYISAANAIVLPIGSPQESVLVMAIQHCIDRQLPRSEQGELLQLNLYTVEGKSAAARFLDHYTATHPAPSSDELDMPTMKRLWLGLRMARGIAKQRKDSSGSVLDVPGMSR